MDAVLNTFGIDWRLLIINAANFGLLLFVLWYFLYGPILRMLEERRRKIAQGVADAEAARRQLEEIESARSHALALAGKEADEVVARARENAREKQEELVVAAETAAASIVEGAEAQARELKSRALQESKEEVAKLIVLGMERAMKERTQ